MMICERVNLRQDGSAFLETYVQEPLLSPGKYRTRPAMVICPGGAYLNIASREREIVAMKFAGMGYDCFVLNYTHLLLTRPLDGSAPELAPECHYPMPLVELIEAMAYVRANAERLHVDANRVYCVGFSAGGHLVGSLAERWDDPELMAEAARNLEAALGESVAVTPEVTKPTGVIMGYPAISFPPESEGFSENLTDAEEYILRAVFGSTQRDPEIEDHYDLRRHVRDDMPRLFVWHDLHDDLTSPAETLEFARLAVERGNEVEAHLFQTGSHGIVFADETNALSDDDIDRCSGWLELARSWLALDDPHVWWQAE